MRVSEATNLKYQDITPDGGYMKILLRKTKNHAERTIYISKSLYDEIRQVYNQDSDYLLHSKTRKKLNRTNMWVQIHRAFKRFVNKEIHPHSLRHWFVMYQIHEKKRDIKAVSQYVGHATVAYTLEIYHHAELSPDEAQIL